jgi:flagellar basal body-associated protein FliL
MKKILLIAAGAAVLLAAAGGGWAVFIRAGQKHAATHASAAPKPLYFAQLADLVVSVPPDSASPASLYIQITLQFATTDQNALTAFNNLQPIIRAQIINLLMAQTAKTIMDPAQHEALSRACLAIVNQVLTSAASYTPPSPFSAAYITSLVEQS